MTRLICLLARPAGVACLETLLSLSPKKIQIVQLWTHRMLPKLETCGEVIERPEYSKFISVAKQAGLNVKSVDSSRESAEMQEDLKKESFDVLISCNWRYRIERQLLDQANWNCVNLHRGKLPEYRGAEPVKRALADGRESICITGHIMTEEIDAGEVLCEQNIPVAIGPKENIDQAVERIKATIVPFYPKVLLACLDSIEQRRNRV